MLIKYENIIKKYNLNVSNILHIGAHKAEEHDTYILNGAKKIIWIEANEKLAKELRLKLDPNINTVIESVISDKDDESVTFTITNNGESSSILELGLHKQLFPAITPTEKIIKKTKTINTIFEENQIDFSFIEFINIDIQGAELLALRGIEDFTNIKGIYTEVNTDYVYKNCALIGEIDDYLKTFNFERVETQMWHNHPWGDALYLRKELV